MKIDEIMKTIVASSVYKKEIGTSFQLGLPMFAVHNEELFVTFYPHIERYLEGSVYYHFPQYELELVYPFRHIVKFKNNAYISQKNIVSYEENNYRHKPICVSAETLSMNRQSVYELFSIADELLGCREKKDTKLMGLVEKYIDQYHVTVDSLGLQAIYGGAYVAHCSF